MELKGMDFNTYKLYIMHMNYNIMIRRMNGKMKNRNRKSSWFGLVLNPGRLCSAGLIDCKVFKNETECQ